MKTKLNKLVLTGLVLLQFNFGYAQWQTNGNSGTNPTNDFVGTIDNVDLVFRTNNIEGFRLSTNGYLGIGLTSPSYMLDIAGDLNLASNQIFRINGNPILSNIGSHNLFLGENAGYSYTSGTDNVFSGYQAGYSNTSGSHHVFSGYKAGYSNTTGSDNVFSGYQAGYTNTTGYSNVFSGYKAGYSNTTAAGNVFSGYQAGYSNTTGYSNVFLGGSAGYSNTTGYYNVFLGGGAGNANTTGYYNVFSGYSAGSSNTTGIYNVFTGALAGSSNTTGYANVFTGYEAGQSNTTGTYNVFTGALAGQVNTTGTYNVFSGYAAGNANTTGMSNVFSGFDAGNANTYGSNNVFTGKDAGVSNTSGNDNDFNGYQAGYSNTTGYSNVFSGSQAGYSNTTGGENTSIGVGANSGNTTGSINTALGSYAGGGTTTSIGNTYLGSNAGSSYDNGNYNTFVGYNSDADADSYANSTALGHGSTITASDQVRVGDANVTSIGGQVGWSTLSDGRVKKNVQTNVHGLDFIKKLHPVTYNLDVEAIDKLLHPDAPKLREGQKPHLPTQHELDAKVAKSKIVYSGFIAQEVEKAANDVGYNFSGVDAPKNDKDIYGLRYAEFTVPLIKAVQEISEENTSLKKANDSLINVINNFNSRLSALENLSKGTGSNTFPNPTNTKQAYLEQNSPNPFTDNTVIKYFVPENTNSAKIVITSDRGLEVMNFVIDVKGSGSVTVSGSTLAIGSYTCQLIIDGKQTDLKKMMLIK